MVRPPGEPALKASRGVGGARAAAPAAFREIRPLRTQEELAACVALQEATWGAAYSDILPASILQVTAKMGGVVTGAFGDAGDLLGFVYGITGLRGGETAHWSHMLAVREDARDRGIGVALKESQRRELRARGVASVYWTFDPLVARNAHLNLNRLGAEVQEYVPNFYGVSGSALHELGTDRFVVKWRLEGGAGQGGAGVSAVAVGDSGGPEPPASGEGHLANAGEAVEATPPPASGEGLHGAEVAVPSDIDALRAESRETAMAWRRATRRAFVSLLGAGYRVRAFEPGPERARYLLAPPRSEASAPGS